jgi:outer membrane autotransporter protein
VAFTVQARPDPTLDPDVGGLIAAQTQTARRFGEAQIENFARRLETLHQDARGGFAGGVSFGLDPDPDDPWEAVRRQRDAGLWPVGPAPSGPGAKAGAAKASAARATADPGKPPSGWATWSGGAIDLGLHRGAAGRSKFRFTTGGVSFGADYRLSDRLIVGAGAGYGRDVSRIGAGGSRVTAENYVGALYGDYRLGDNTFIDVVIGYGALSFDSRRHIDVDSTFANGQRHGREIFASVTAGHDYRRGPLLVSTYGRLDSIQGALEAFTEAEVGGGTNALSFDRQTLSMLSSTLGLRGAYAVRSSAGLWSPHIRLEYKYDFQTAGLASLQYADARSGPTYSVEADPESQTRFVFELGTDLRRRATSFSLDYRIGANGRQEVVQQLIGKFGLRF